MRLRREVSAVKSYHLLGVTKADAVSAVLSELLPGQTHPWLLLESTDDTIAYFRIVGHNEVQADVSGRHYDEDAAVLDVLEVLRTRVGGVIEHAAMTKIPRNVLRFERLMYLTLIIGFLFAFVVLVLLVGIVFRALTEHV